MQENLREGGGVDRAFTSNKSQCMRSFGANFTAGYLSVVAMVAIQTTNNSPEGNVVKTLDQPGNS